MNETFIDIILGTIIVIIVAYMISRIDYSKNDRTPKLFYGYDECEECDEVRIHRILLQNGKTLDSDCLACSLGNERYDDLEAILNERAEIECEKFKEMVKSWSEEER